ncbi:branched-chain amino acid ABC transporter permease [Candidatus Symbiopectobacterium sp. 'North America']|uniref:AzlC family ABC transporter permease n=1 Tax=Candidatus Symbiopectobacterium sp. 'North America' TaxID=2794574 RepID=UPI0018C976D4|nr:AzlC family ABC transporter permease [Candidatus Symbiopectobacterium sp. 'North America']MBG6245267.1 branched-chain amino acid ABC transporter permease [Candidatus Symbiopectobacterium sp. 'North America']
MEKHVLSQPGAAPNASLPDTRWRDIRAGVLDMFPFCLAVLPWGILAGSMAVQAGLPFWQSIGLSALVFAGAAQLVTLGLVMSGANVVTILITVFFITTQHIIYALTLHDYVSRLALRYRLPIGFLLTDELFALSGGKSAQQSRSVSYLIAAGGFFYVCWVIFSLAGIVMATRIPDLARYHLDFSIIATFITILVPMVRSISSLLGVLLSLVLSMALAYFHVEGAVVIAGLSGMFFSALLSRRGEEEL